MKKHKKHKYVVVSPPSSAGGPIVLHALCKYLNQIGENAKIFYPCSFDANLNEFPYLNYIKYCIKNTIKSILKTISKKARIKYGKYDISLSLKCKRKILPFVGKNTIVIYPEITHGNILHAKKVVRWLLYHNKIYKQNGAETIGYDKNDLFFCYRDVFNDPILNPDCNKLHVASFDLDTYKRYNFGEREGNCYIIRKGKHRPDLPSTFDGQIIDDLSEKEKVEFFNKCKYCISYDTQTTYSQIAAMCGCISVVVPEPGKTREDYRAKEDSCHGVAFGFSDDEINFAKDTQFKIKEQFENVLAESIDEVRKFVNTCERYFNK